MSIYKVEMYIQGTQEDMTALYTHLAQTVYDEFELGAVFRVKIELDEDDEPTRLADLFQ